MNAASIEIAGYAIAGAAVGAAVGIFAKQKRAIGRARADPVKHDWPTLRRMPGVWAHIVALHRWEHIDGEAYAAAGEALEKLSHLTTLDPDSPEAPKAAMYMAFAHKQAAQKMMHRLWDASDAYYTERKKAHPPTLREHMEGSIDVFDFEGFNAAAIPLRDYSEGAYWHVRDKWIGPL